MKIQAFLLLTLSALGLQAQADTTKERKLFRDSSGYEWYVDVWKNATSRQTWSKFSFFLPHSNERTALSVATEFVQQEGGWVFAIDCGGERECDGRDPNRMFGDSRFADSVFNVVFGRYVKTAVTLHNNTDGGDLKVKADPRNNGAKFSSGSGYQRHYYFGGDRDDFVLIIGREDSPSSKNLDLLRRMEQRRINVIYEIYSSQNDGSMSFAAVERGYFYANIEAEHGHEQAQKVMLQELVSFISGR